MTEQPQQPMDQPCKDQPVRDIDLLDIIFGVIRKRRLMIVALAIVTAFAMAAISLFMTNVYQAKAVIMPVAAKESGSSAGLAALASQFGGLPGISMPGSASGSEIVGLLKSNILREKIIRQYKLMPTLFYKQWDPERQAWKEEGGGFIVKFRRYLSQLSRDLAPVPPEGAPKDPNIPDIWDALRLLEEIVAVKLDTRQNTITITADFHDPGMAAKIVEFFLVTLTNHMSSEAKRVATTNRKYLEAQLGSTADPFIRQKTYNMVAQQIETAMMAEVKENFAFKVIDPPLAPDKKIKPKRLQMVTLSFLAALVVGICLAFFLEYIEKSKARRT